MPPEEMLNIIHGESAEEYRAADLPEGSVVATENIAWIKFRRTAGAVNWHTTAAPRGTGGLRLVVRRVGDQSIDWLLDHGGGEVLRVGTGQED